MFEAATCQQMYRENVAPVLGRWTRELHHRIRSDVTAAMTEERPSKRKAAGDLRREDVDAESDGEANDGPNVDLHQASEETLKTRKFVKAKRRGAAGETHGNGASNPFASTNLTAQTKAAGSNPFSGVSLAAPPSSNPFANVSMPGQGGGFGAFAAAAAAAAGGAKADAGGGAPRPDGASPPSNEAQAASLRDGGSRDAQAGVGADESDKGGEAASRPREVSAAGAAPCAGLGGFGGFAAATQAGGFGAFAALHKEGASDKPGEGATVFGSAKPLDFGNSQFSGLKFDFASAAKAPPTTLFGASSKPALEAKVVATGEEGEDTVFSAHAKLFEYGLDSQWHERGVGELRVNVAKEGGQARLVMRSRTGRLVLNARLFADMALTEMEGGKGATFSCINSAAVPLDKGKGQANDGRAGAASDDGKEGERTTEGAAGSGAEEGASAGGEDAAKSPEKDGAAGGEPGPQALRTYAVKVRTSDLRAKFLAAVSAHKGNRSAAAVGADNVRV